jgi:hypothetical protein
MYSISRNRVQMNAAVACAVQHHMPSLEPVAREKVTRALQKRLRSAVAGSLDPGSCTCQKCNVAIVEAFHYIGCICAICCATWWSSSGSLPEAPKFATPSKSWNAQAYSEFASAYFNWDDSAFGSRALEDMGMSGLRRKLDAALSLVRALCSIVCNSCPALPAAPSSPSAPSDPLLEDLTSSGLTRPLAERGCFGAPRGLALVTTMAMCLTVLHRESLWLHARQFPTFFKVSSERTCGVR